MKKSNFTSKMSLLLVFMLVAALACGCGKETETTPVVTESSVQEAPESSSVEETVAESSVEESSEEESSEEASSAEETTSEEVVAEEYKTLGEGANEFTFEMTLGDETVGYKINTDETTVGAALLGLDLIGGEESQYGLFVTTVMGNDPTSEADGTPYWAFYIDGGYAPTGVDSTDITPGSTYSFVVETY